MNTKDINITTKTVRDSNMELLRIVAMFLVLIVHADFLTLGIPTTADASEEGLSVFSRLLVESFSLVCVNVFVLISGWYGIKPKLARGLEFLFQVFFIMLVALFINILLLGHQFVLNDIKNILLLNDVMWFPKSYLLLYILAPVLNSFIENSSERKLRDVLICFYGFNILYGWLCGGVGWFNSGYSTISFIGLYLLARYCKLFLSDEIIKYSFVKYVSCEILLSIVVSIVWLFLIQKGCEKTPKWFMPYNSPFIILQSLMLLFAFTKLSFRNKFVNWVASSCFAVYLFHCSPGILDNYLEIEKKLYQQDLLPYLSLSFMLMGGYLYSL